MLYDILCVTNSVRGLRTMRGNFGFIHEKIEIKILILFILRHLPEPVPYDMLTELVMCDDGISYFDYTECIADLIKTEHIRFDENRYSLTVKGARNGEITENSLPFSVRVKAEKITSAFRAAQSRDSMIKTHHVTNPEGGFTVGMGLSDGLGTIISLDVFTANEQQAAFMEKNFRNNAERIYNALMDMLLGS